jgi:hypothetical protein
MIKCLQLEDGKLPALENLPATTHLAATGTLTEVVTAAIYGAPMKAGDFHKAEYDLRQEFRILWRNANGPAWLCEHLKLIAKGQTWPLPADTQDRDERRTIDQFDRAQRWLAELRRLEVEHAIPAALAEKATALRAMTDDEAIAYALAEAGRIARAENAINAKATAFYQLLNEAIQNKGIALKAIATDPETGAWTGVAASEPPHRTIPADYYILNICHDLFDNKLEVYQTSSAEMAKTIFNRVDEQNDRVLVKWLDVRVPPNDAAWLLSTFRSDGTRTADQRPSIGSEPRQGSTWNPAWLSLPGAMMWVVTRDESLTKIADSQTDNDHSIELGISCHLAQEKARTGQSCRTFIESKDAWPEVRRLIADEKILAEGRSLERRAGRPRLPPGRPSLCDPSAAAAGLIGRH